MIRKALLIFISIVCHAFAATPIVDIYENDSRQTAPVLIFSDNKTYWKKELSKNYKILNKWIDSSTYFKHTQYVSPVIEFIAYLSAQIESSEDGIDDNNENIRCKESGSFSLHNLEKWHDYIQWIFPINTKGMSPAPLITKNSLQVLKDARLNNNYEIPFKTIMKFYGQEPDKKSGLYKTIEAVE